MPIDETKLTKVQLRKLSALRKSVGADLGEEVFIKWLARQANPKDKADPIAVKIIEALRGLENEPEVPSRQLRIHNTSRERQKPVGFHRVQE